MATPKYMLTELPTPGMFTSAAAMDISDDSVVVGGAGAPPVLPGTQPVTQAVMWKSGTPQLIGDGSFNPSHANAVNSEEQAVGNITVGEEVYANHAFLYSGGQVQDIAVALHMSYANAWDINDAGVVVGRGAAGSAEARAFIWDSKGSGAPILLTPNSSAIGINTAGTVYGTLNISEKICFIYRNGQVQQLPQGVFLSDLSKTNEWVTGYTSPGNSRKAFRFDASLTKSIFGPIFAEVGPPDAYWSMGDAINDDGVTTGLYSVPGDENAYVFVDFPAWSPFAGAYNLAEVVTNGAGWKFSRAHAINNVGTIVGSGEYQGQTRAFLLTQQVTDFSNIESAFDILIGGVTSGGGGTGISGSKPHKIPPHWVLGPFGALWRQAFRNNPDLLVGMFVERLALLSENPKTRELLDRTARQILKEVSQSKTLGKKMNPRTE